MMLINRCFGPTDKKEGDTS